MKPTNNLTSPLKVSFSSTDDYLPIKNNNETRKKIGERSRSKSSPQMRVRIPDYETTDWPRNKSDFSDTSSFSNDASQSKKNIKENFLFTMPSELLSSNSDIEVTINSEKKIPIIDTKNLSDSRSHSPQTNLSVSSPQSLQSSHSPQSPRLRGLSVSSRRLSSKYSNSSSTHSSPENLTPRSLDSGQSSPSTGRKSPRNPLQRAMRSIHDTIIFQKKDLSSSSTSSASTSPREIQNESLLNKITDAELKGLAKKITHLKNSDHFKNLPSANQRILIQAQCYKYLNPTSFFQDPNKIDILIHGLQPYLAFEESRIDKEIDLADPQFLDFINSAAEAAFIKTWDKDSSDVDFDLKKYMHAVKPTFARDFHHSNYFIQNSDGSNKKLESIDEFIDFFKESRHSDLPKLISNIASQNLGNFFQNALFLRQDENQQSHSILQSSVGTPLLPLAVAKASYTFKKREDGSVDIVYERNSSQEINGIKEMRAKQLNGELNSIAVKDATLKIQANIHVKQDDTWNIFNPHVIAQGWI